MTLLASDRWELRVCVLLAVFFVSQGVGHGQAEPECYGESGPIREAALGFFRDALNRNAEAVAGRLADNVEIVCACVVGKERSIMDGFAREWAMAEPPTVQIQSVDIKVCALDRAFVVVSNVVPHQEDGYRRVHSMYLERDAANGWQIHHWSVGEGRTMPATRPDWIPGATYEPRSQVIGGFRLNATVQYRDAHGQLRTVPDVIVLAGSAQDDACDRKRETVYTRVGSDGSIEIQILGTYPDDNSCSPTEFYVGEGCGKLQFGLRAAGCEDLDFEVARDDRQRTFVMNCELDSQNEASPDE